MSVFRPKRNGGGVANVKNLVTQAEHAELIGEIKAINIKLDNMDTQKLSAMSSMLTDIHTRLFVGSNGSPPLTIELDRLKQAQQSRIKHFVVLYSAAVAGFFYVLFEAVREYLMHPPTPRP